MEIVTFDEFINSWRPFYLLAVALTLVGIGRWFYNEATGRNYYKKYPVAKAIEELAKSGELDSKNIDKALLSIDLDKSSQIHVEQFTQNIRNQ